MQEQRSPFQQTNFQQKDIDFNIFKNQKADNPFNIQNNQKKENVDPLFIFNEPKNSAYNKAEEQKKPFQELSLEQIQQQNKQEDANLQNQWTYNRDKVPILEAEINYSESETEEEDESNEQHIPYQFQVKNIENQLINKFNDPNQSFQIDEQDLEIRELLLKEVENDAEQEQSEEIEKIPENDGVINLEEFQIQIDLLQNNENQAQKQQNEEQSEKVKQEIDQLQNENANLQKDNQYLKEQLAEITHQTRFMHEDFIAKNKKLIQAGQSIESQKMELEKEVQQRDQIIENMKQYLEQEQQKQKKIEIEWTQLEQQIKNKIFPKSRNQACQANFQVEKQKKIKNQFEFILPDFFKHIIDSNQVLQTVNIELNSTLHQLEKEYRQKLEYFQNLKCENEKQLQQSAILLSKEQQTDQTIQKYQQKLKISKDIICQIQNKIQSNGNDRCLSCIQLQKFTSKTFSMKNNLENSNIQEDLIQNQSGKKLYNSSVVVVDNKQNSNSKRSPQKQSAKLTSSKPPLFRPLMINNKKLQSFDPLDSAYKFYEDKYPNFPNKKDQKQQNEAKTNLMNKKMDHSSEDERQKQNITDQLDSISLNTNQYEYLTSELLQDTYQSPVPKSQLQKKNSLTVMKEDDIPKVVTSSQVVNGANQKDDMPLVATHSQIIGQKSENITTIQPATDLVNKTSENDTNNDLYPKQFCSSTEIKANQMPNSQLGIYKGSSSNYDSVQVASDDLNRFKSQNLSKSSKEKKYEDFNFYGFNEFSQQLTQKSQHQIEPEKQSENEQKSRASDHDQKNPLKRQSKLKDYNTETSFFDEVFIKNSTFIVFGISNDSLRSGNEDQRDSLKSLMRSSHLNQLKDSSCNPLDRKSNQIEVQQEINQQPKENQSEKFNLSASNAFEQSLKQSNESDQKNYQTIKKEQQVLQNCEKSTQSNKKQQDLEKSKNQSIKTRGFQETFTQDKNSN